MPGKGAIYASSTKQKLNSKSLTEAKLGSVNNAMHQVLWTSYFLEVQDYAIMDNLVQWIMQCIKTTRVQCGQRRIKKGQAGRKQGALIYTISSLLTILLQEKSLLTITHQHNNGRFLHQGSPRKSIPNVQRPNFECAVD
eukprot:14043547-Ditylum_brightwellii.AAC.2